MTIEHNLINNEEQTLINENPKIIKDIENFIELYN